MQPTAKGVYPDAVVHLDHNAGTQTRLEYMLYQCPMPYSLFPMPDSQRPIPNAQCLVPSAQCPVPSAQCLINAQCPMPN